MTQNIGEYLGYQMILEGYISYCCPALKIYGAKDERELQRLMRAELKKREKRLEKLGQIAPEIYGGKG